MGSWSSLMAPVLLLIAYLQVPGTLIALAAGVRGLLAVTLAPALAIGALALSAPVAQVLQIGWGPVAYLVVAALVAALTFAASQLTTRRRAAPRPTTDSAPATSTPYIARPATTRWLSPTSLAGYAGIIGAAALWVRHMRNMMPGPESFSQTYDNVFHLSVIRLIADTGIVGPLLPRDLDPATLEQIFYPTAWHQLAVLALPASDSIASASNAALFTTVGWIWPASLLALVAVVVRASAPTLLVTGVLSASFPAFPFLMLEWGVLYPNMLGYALVPTVFALAALALRTPPAFPPIDDGNPLPATEVAAEGPSRAVGAAEAREGGPFPPRLPTLVLGALTLLGVTLAHPNALILALVLLLPTAAVGAAIEFRAWRSGAEHPRKALAFAAVLLTAVAGTVFLFLTARPSNLPWGPIHSPATAVGEIALNNPIGRPVAVAVSILMAAGVVRLIRTGPARWLLASLALLGVLWVAASAGTPGDLRAFLTGVWYSDVYRLGAALPLLAAPLAAIGSEWLARATTGAGVRSLSPSGRHAGRTGLHLGAAAAVAILLPAAVLLTTQFGEPVRTALAITWGAYDLAPDQCSDDDMSCLITEDELALLSRLPETTPPDALIVTNPQNGSSLAYALGGRDVTLTYIGQRPSPAVEVLLQSFDDPTQIVSVCRAVNESGATHVLDFGTQTVHPGMQIPPGLDQDLRSSPLVDEVDRQGGAVLLEIVGCG